MDCSGHCFYCFMCYDFILPPILNHMNKNKTNTKLVATIIILALLCAIIFMYATRSNDAKKVIPAGRSTPTSSNNAFEDLESKLKKSAIEEYSKKYNMIMVRKKEFLDAHPIDNLDPMYFSDAETLKSSFRKSVFTVCAIEALLNQLPQASLIDLEVFLHRITTGNPHPEINHPSHDIMASKADDEMKRIIGMVLPVLKREFNTPTQPYFVSPRKQTSLAF